jgi:hypothetical protein
LIPVFGDFFSPYFQILIIELRDFTCMQSSSPFEADFKFKPFGCQNNIYVAVVQRERMPVRNKHTHINVFDLVQLTIVMMSERLLVILTLL